MSDLVKNTIRFFAFLGVQIYVLNRIPHIHQYIIPYIYYLFILWLPFSISRVPLLLIGFFTGLMLDFFSMQMGVHAAACTLIAFVRPFVISILLPKESTELTYKEPSIRTMGWTPYFTYVFILTLFHHIYLTFLQWLQVGGFLDFIIKIFSTTAISMLLILIVELLFNRKPKNTRAAA